MVIDPSYDILERLVKHQIGSLFLLDEKEGWCLSKILPSVLLKTEICFSFSLNKYYRKDGKVFFSVYNAAQYCIFLYFVSRELYVSRKEYRQLADKVYYLNRSLNGIDLFYEVEMPEVFYLDHPLGSVLGRAQYGNHFRFAQGCTVGNNKGFFPVIGENVTMFSGSKILGRCMIGDNVWISANSYIKDTDIPSDSIVFGSYPDLLIKPKR
jgi:serine O-acetyltransferase